MIKTLVVLFSLSLSFASDFSADKWKELFEQFQKNYRTFSIDDIKKFQSMVQSNNYQASARDMEEFLGEWYRVHETAEFYITVDSDQSVPNMMALSAMIEAEGEITAIGSDFEEQLTYILDPSTMDQGNDDYNWACDVDGETQWYESEDECNMYCENDCYYDDEADEADDVTEGMVMNMSFFEFFTLLFGMAPENVDVPVVVAFQLDMDLVVQGVEGMVFTDNGEAIELKADSVDLATGAVFSDDENTITFTSLELKDSLQVSQLMGKLAQERWILKLVYLLYCQLSILKCLKEKRWKMHIWYLTMTIAVWKSMLRKMSILVKCIVTHLTMHGGWMTIW